MLVLSAAFVLLSAAGWVAYNETFLARARPAEGLPVSVRAQVGVSDQEVDTALEALREADRYLTQVLDAPALSHVTLKLATFSRCVPYLPLSQTGSAVADADELCVNARRKAWPQVQRDPAAATWLLAHERFHNLQGQLGCLPSPGEHEYAWWVEGSATWVGFETAVSAGLLSRKEAEAELRSWQADEPDAGRLRDYEAAIHGDAQYATAAQAMTSLLRSSGPSSLVTFCAAVGDGRPWRAAFDDAFDVTVDDFYRQLDEAAADR